MDGTGALSGVTSLTSDGYDYCGLLANSQIDCWGWNYSGELGNGTTTTLSICDCSDIPTAVVGVSGTGALSGVASLASDNNGDFCAVLASSHVDCWGGNYSGELGNGTTGTTGCECSDTPTQVVGVGGTGTLSGVVSLAGGSGSGDCALLTSGQVDCWGGNLYGDLGNGATNTTGCDCSNTPTPVVGVGGTGTLSGVASLTSDEGGYCAVLPNGQLDCWGYNVDGELGNGSIINSDTPTHVVGIGGTGTLSGVASTTSTVVDYDHDGGYCAVFVSGEVDCWGSNYSGQLGNGTNTNSETPTQVVAAT